MWWKLTILTLVTVVLVVAVQPIKTHAVKIDIPLTGEVPAPPRTGLADLLENIYFTPTSLLISAAIVALAAYLAFRIIKS